MGSLLLGGVIIVAAIFGSLKTGGSVVYVQGSALEIVLGGTLGLLFILTPNAVLKNLAESLRGMVVPEPKIMDLQRELTLISQKKRLPKPSPHPLIRYVSELYEQGVDAALFEELARQKAYELEAKAVDSIQSLKNLAKYPPALGMTGTVMGMIGLFAELESSKNSIGSHLSIAMTATFYGLILSNAVIGPIADRLEVSLSRTTRINQTILDIVLLINHNEPQSVIEDELRARVA